MTSLSVPQSLSPSVASPLSSLSSSPSVPASSPGRPMAGEERGPPSLVLAVQQRGCEQSPLSSLLSNSLTMNNSLMTILVLGLASVSALSTVEIKQGDSLTLYCPLYVTNNSLILWSRDTRILFVGDLRIKGDERYNVVNDNLIVTQIKDGDGGTFSCQVEDEHKQLEIFTYQVTILKSPQAKIDVGSYLAVKLGTHLALRCTGSGVPEPEVIWRREGEILSRGLGEAGILLEYITREDAGDIVCEASNGVGDTTARDVLSLDVLYSPQVEMIQPHISFQPQCGLELQCEVHSSSEPGVSWYHNNLQLQPSEGLTIWSLENLHVLQISSCDHSIIGQFSCRATNNLGDGEASINISKLWIERKISEILSENKNSNNVRRNVELTQEKALPLVSSASKNIFSASALIIILISILRPVPLYW